MLKRIAVVMLGAVIGSVSVSVAQEDVLTVIAHDSFAYSEAVLEAFTAETGIAVEVIRLGDAGSLVNQAVLSRSNPLGDVLFGVDNTFLSRAIDGEIFVPYESPLLETVDASFIVDEEFRVTPINYGDVCLNYDVSYFDVAEVDLPETLDALTDPSYSGLLVVENPATSSPGLAFLMTTIAVYGEEGDYTYLDFWSDLRANDVYVADDWTEAYYAQFSGSTGEGTRPLVVSYASSPPAEVYYSETPTEDAPTDSIVGEGMCFRQIEFAGILAGTDQEAEAQQFIDFMLSVPFQEDLPLNMFVFPVNSEAVLPEVFEEYAPIPENPITLDYTEIGENRERWLEEWTVTVIR